MYKLELEQYITHIEPMVLEQYILPLVDKLELGQCILPMVQQLELEQRILHIGPLVVQQLGEYMGRIQLFHT